LPLINRAPSTTPRQGTRNWLRTRRVGWWHHVRTWADDADFDRLARHICGRSRALVLSGGGSRGLAHLGVIRTLEDRGMPIDVVGGTSQGAFMGASYAMVLSTAA
jgi:predicted acylesterase/phospholipase RssA